MQRDLPASAHNGEANYVYSVLPLAVIHPDPHQPRTEKRNIPELAESIENQGLQQAIVVNPSAIIDGVQHYFIDKGERRYLAHEYLEQVKGLPEFSVIGCLVGEKIYDGKRSITRRLAQYAENDQREPQTRKETIALLTELIEEERELRRVSGESEHGCIGVGIEKLCKAVGRPKSWGDKHWLLAGLIPELIDLLDLNSEEERLGFAAAMRLAPAPREDQMKIFVASATAFKKGGHTARAAFIHHKVRTLRIENGEKIRGRVVDEKRRLLDYAASLELLNEKLAAGRNNREYLAHTELVLRSMNFGELHKLINALKVGIAGFNGLLAKAEAEKQLK